MELNVLNISGKETGRKAKLSEEVFGIEPNDHVIYLDVKQYRANQRQGTHKSKERGEVKGSTRKIKRQKGSGTARAGSIKSPVFRGGGRIFGPKPRDYSFKLNKKVKLLAKKSAIAYKLKENNLLIVEDFDFQEVKTKKMLELKKNLKINDKKLLLVLPKENKSVYLSARNLKKTKVLTASNITTYDVLDSQTLVLTESSLDFINKKFGSTK
ncbi:MAG: 50S ribosomal protein L4 [Bacteroidia bacterium]|nr:MAG: 50S ribosomal protein L4 [Bacteroidia bacterium]